MAGVAFVLKDLSTPDSSPGILLAGLTGMQVMRGIEVVPVVARFTDGPKCIVAIRAVVNASSTVTWYKLRARDNGSGPPAVYRTWTSIDPASSPPAPPAVGAWIEQTIVDEWAV